MNTSDCRSTSLRISARDMLDVFPSAQQDDEDYLTVVRPKQLRGHVIVDGVGLAAFSLLYTAHDEKGVRWTGLFVRYKAYADDIVCPGLFNVTSKAQTNNRIFLMFVE